MPDAKITISATDLATDVIKGVSQAMQGVTGDVKMLGENLTQWADNPVQAARAAATGFVEDLGPVGVGLVAVGAAGAAVGAELFNLADQAGAAGESVLAFSRLTNIAVVDVSALRYAADVGGGSLDQMGAILQQMTRKMEAGGPSLDKMRDGLSNIGIDFDTFAALSPAEKIEALSEGFRQGSVTGNDMAAAIDIMGRAGAQQLPFLKKNLDDLIETGKDKGVPWSEQSAQQAEQFEEKTRALKEELGNLSTELGQSLIPAMTLAIEVGARTAEAFVHIADLGGLVSGGYHLLTGALGENALATETAAAKQDVINKAIAEGAPATIAYGDAVKYVADQWAALHPVAKEAGDDTVFSKAQMKDWDDQVKKNTEDAAKHAEAIAKDVEAIRTGAKPNADMVAALEQVGNGLVQGTAEAGRWVDEVGKMIKAGDDVPPLLRAMYAEMQPLPPAIKLMTGGITDQTVAVAGLIVPFERLNSDLDLFAEKIPIMTGGIIDQNAATAGAMHNFESLNGPVDRTRQANELFGVSTSKAAADLRGMSQILGDIPSDFGKVASSVASVGESIFQGFKSGGALGAAIGGVSSLISVLSGIGGPSKEELSARDDQSKMIDQLKDLATQGEITEGALSDNYHTIAIVARDAYMKTGESADEAETHVKALLDTHDPAAFSAALAGVNKVLKDNAADAQAAAAATSRLAGDVNSYTKNGVADQGTMARASQSVIEAFTAQVKATGNVGGALAALGPSLAAIKTGETDLGLSGGAAIDQLLRMQDVTAANKPLMDSISGATALITDLGAAGVLTHDDLTAFGQDAYNQFTALEGKTGDAKEAMVLMQPELQALWEGQQKFGTITDESTKKLLDQAQQQGLVGPDMQSDNDKMLSVLKDIRDVIAEATGNTKGFADELGKLPTSKTITIDQHYTSDGAPVVPMAAGGDVVVTRPTLFLAGEAGPERATFSGANRVGFAAPDSVSTSAMHEELKGLRRDTQGLRSDLKLLPMMLKHALRGARH